VSSSSSSSPFSFVSPASAIGRKKGEVLVMDFSDNKVN
jgi:hypothetical protein